MMLSGYREISTYMLLIYLILQRWAILVMFMLMLLDIVSDAMYLREFFLHAWPWSICVYVMQACEVLSKPQKSLAYLLETYCGVMTDKSFQVWPRSWMIFLHWMSPLVVLVKAVAKLCSMWNNWIECNACFSFDSSVAYSTLQSLE